MIPHHQNAVNMAKALMKHHPDEVGKVEDLGGLLMELINGQNYQIHQFRAYLKENPSERFCKDDYVGRFGFLATYPKQESGYQCKRPQFVTPFKCKKYPAVREFCPVSCDVPCPTSCVDSVVPWFYKNQTDILCNTTFFDMKDESKRNSICNRREDIAHMCPETCGLC
mmetsp:Transcript_38140/g.74703  ORF Transcript_38140/g.74703 Transcript_38140/m.74703 type:complete len:168 (+) Transcript_38140:2-505(+)